MLTGLEILLDRMKTNPEEFLKDNHVPYEGEMFGGKWADLLDYAWRVADDEERQVLDAARKEFYRDDFNERVMKRLAGEEVKEEVSPYIVKQSSAQATYPHPHTAAQKQQTALQNSIHVSNGGSGGTWADPRAIYGSQATQAAQQNMAAQNSLLVGNGGTGVQGVVQGGFGQAQVRQEGAAIGVDPSFWSGVVSAGKGKLW